MREAKVRRAVNYVLGGRWWQRFTEAERAELLNDARRGPGPLIRSAAALAARHCMDEDEATKYHELGTTYESAEERWERLSPPLAGGGQAPRL